MSFGFCYDPYDPGWGGKAQPGALALRQATMAYLPKVGDLGILRDRSRCNKSSAHCHGRAWDAKIAPQDIALGDELAAFYIRDEVAKALGIQRVIWGFGPKRPAREWDSREGQRFWSAYSGAHHDDHVHVELCWAAARSLSVQQITDAFDRYWPGQEDDMFETKDRDNLAACVDALYAGGVSSKGEPLDRFVKAHFQALTARLEALAGESKERDLRAIAVLEELRSRPPGGVSEVDARAVVDEFWKRLEA